MYRNCFVPPSLKWSVTISTFTLIPESASNILSASNVSQPRALAICVFKALSLNTIGLGVSFALMVCSTSTQPTSVVSSTYPLGGRGYTQELLTDETISSIAAAHEISAAQVILRWDLQRGIVVIPGSSNPEHIRENLDLFGFELTSEEMEQIAVLDRDEKHDWY